MRRRKISEADRWLAVAALSFCADDREFRDGMYRHYPGDVVSRVSASTAVDIAEQAAAVVFNASFGRLTYGDQLREAAGLLADGWNPGDPVEVRR